MKRKYTKEAVIVFSDKAGFVLQIRRLKLSIPIRR